MQFVCDAPKGRAWFRLETEDEAEAESALMRHAVNRYFERERARARALYQPADPTGIERDIGLKAHLTRTMPLFLTLRDSEGGGLATAMLPPGAKVGPRFQIVIVGANNANPYPQHADAIAALARHYRLDLPETTCYPYGK